MGKTMKALVYRAPHELAVEERELHEVGPDDVIIAPTACTICGGELHCFRAGIEARPDRTFGHEYVGVVTEVGENVTAVRPGDRAWGMVSHPCGKSDCEICNSGMWWMCPETLNHCTGHGERGALAEYVWLDRAEGGNGGVTKIPDSIPDSIAIFLEPLSFTHAVVEQTGVKEGDKVLVFGAGFIGNTIMQHAKMKGAEVICIDKSTYRLEKAKEFGADHIVNATTEDVRARVKEIWGAGRWYHGECGLADVAIDACGGEDALRNAVHLLHMGGTLSMIAPSEELVGVNLHELVFKQLQFRTPGGNNVKETLELMQQGAYDQIANLVSHRFTLDDAPLAFETQANPYISMKVIVDIHPEQAHE